MMLSGVGERMERSMGSVIADVLPLAVGIAISPIPIIAVILMLLSPHAKGTSVGFMIGWIAGVVVAIVLFLLSSVMPKGTGGPSPIGAVIKIIVGALLLFLALKQWRARPAKGEQPTMPKWMSAIDTMTAGKAIGLGFLLSAVNPKNLLLAVSAGLIVGGAGLTFRQASVVIIIFVLLAASTVI